VILREWLLALVGVILLAFGASQVARVQGPMQEIVLNAGPACPAVPLLVLEPAAPSSGGSVVVFHGLGANRLVMLTLGQWMAASGLRVFLMDFPGHGDNPSAFSFSRAEECAARALETLERQGQISSQRTILLGHSMGGGVVIRLADRFPAAGTIAIAPAPEVFPRRMPVNLLLVTPRFDFPAIKAMAEKLVAAAGGPRDSAEDFRQRRAFRQLQVAERSHTTVMFDPRVVKVMTRWAAASLGANPEAIPAPLFAGLAGGGLGVLGIICIFPLAASGFARGCGAVARAARGARTAPAARDRAGSLTVILFWVFAALLSVGVLAYGIPLKFIHMYSADYLASLGLLSSLPLLLLVVNQQGGWKGQLGANARALAAAAMLGMVTVLVLGGWLNWQLTDAWPTLARWSRFPVLLAALFPYCLAEEAALGPPSSPGIRARGVRFATYLALRFIFWLATAFAVWAGLSGALLAVVFVVFMTVFSVFQRLGTDAVRRRMGSAAAAALFNAILAAWFLAAAFPLT
jgi:pimeloyl-ACP methyl ester carboxylesterase